MKLRTFPLPRPHCRLKKVGEAENRGTGTSANCASRLCLWQCQATDSSPLGKGSRLEVKVPLIPLKSPPDGYQRRDERGHQHPAPSWHLHSVAFQLVYLIPIASTKICPLRGKKGFISCQPSLQPSPPLPGRTPGALTSSSCPVSVVHGPHLYSTGRKQHPARGGWAPSSLLWLHLLGSPRVDEMSGKATCYSDRVPVLKPKDSGPMPAPPQWGSTVMLPSMPPLQTQRLGLGHVHPPSIGRPGTARGSTSLLSDPVLYPLVC